MIKCNRKSEKVYIGMDVSQKTIEMYAVCGDKKAADIPKIETNKEAIGTFLNELPDPSRVCIVMETGTHSGWMSRYIESRGFEVIVAHARDLALIYCSDKKNDKIDAEKLARLAQADKSLLHPIQHMSEERQRDLTVLKSRELLVAQRTKIVNSIRGQLRSLGYSDKGFTVENMKNAYDLLPDEIKDLFAPLLQSLNMISHGIKTYDQKINQLCKKYSATKIVRQITGIGPIISLAFVLIVGNPKRFRNISSISSYFGLAPKQDQSGETDKQLSISKSGNKLMRRLLVQGSQYIMGSFGPDCDLRRFGERIAARGGPIAKRKAKVAVARKLATVMLTRWKTPDIAYDPDFKKNRRKQKKVA